MTLKPEFFQFLSDLENNNDRDWFLENKTRYERDVKIPFAELIDQIKTSLDDPLLSSVETKKMIFRLNRDIRFSKDKSPYKTYVSALISPFGTKDKSFPSNYLQISATEWMIAGGIYWFENRELLKQVREFLLKNNKEFGKLLQNNEFVENFGEIQGDKNKRVPKEFVEFGKIQPLIANTQFFWSAKFSPEMLQEKNAVKAIVTCLKSANGLLEFFRNAVN